MKTSADVVVIGAGISGLTAARALKKSGIDVLVLEARDRVGGRMYTIQNHMSKYLDLGASYVAPNFKRLFQLIKEFGLKTLKTNDTGDWIYYHQGKTKRFTSVFPPAGGIISWLDMNNMLRLLYLMGLEVPLDAPWKAKKAEEWDKMTMQEFIDRHAWTKAGRDIVAETVKLNNTIDPHEVSLLYILWLYRTAGGVHMISATQGGAQEQRVIGGTQQICSRMAENLGEGNVLLNQAVFRIDQTGSDVIVSTIGGNKFKCTQVILTTPLTLQAQITFSPPLSVLRGQLIQRVPMGCVMKAFLYYSTPFWKEKGYCGSSYITDPESLVAYTLDNSGPDGSVPALVAFVVAANARRAAEMTLEERKSHITKLLAAMFLSEEALKPVHYEEKNWSGEEFTGGCYHLSMPPGALTSFGKVVREPVDKVFFAGTETATEWVGYMEGAIQSGERAAKQVLFTRGLVTDKEMQDEMESNSQDEDSFSDRIKMSFLERHAPSVPGLLSLLGLASVGLAAYSRL